MNESLLGFPAGQNTAEPVTGLGYGQTWQNVAGSRASGTTYYNTTGKPIAVSVRLDAVNSNAAGTIAVNGLTLVSADMANATYDFTLYAIIPVGASYIVTYANVNLLVWAELR